jgi:uncharacterized protein (TIGR02452 family)
MQIDRERATQLGHETAQILERGEYQTAKGKVISIREALDHAVQHTHAYPPDAPIPDIQPTRRRRSRIEVINETTLSAAKRLVDAGQRVAALNFASATSPGGGFLGGARAQEESLARSSGLYACLKGQPMYQYHHQHRDPMYSDYALYSPDVPVFRTDAGLLLDQPYLCSFITCAAVNAKVIPAHQKTKIKAVMEQRIDRVLAIAALHEIDALILGAWGCGAFGNDSRQIAELFGKALRREAAGAFKVIVFAITDWSEERRFIGPFQRVFANQRHRTL